MELNISNLVDLSLSNLNISLLEIGCRPTGKITQVRKKKQLLLSNLEKSIPLNLSGGIAHYSPSRRIDVDDAENPVDYSIYCKYFSDEMFNFSERDILSLYLYAKDKKSNYFLEKFLNTHVRDFHKFIRRCKKSAYTNLRGRVAEIMFHNCITNNLIEGISYFRNQITKISNEYYYTGTEIDGVFVFDDKIKFIDYLGILDSKDNLEVRINKDFISK